jgi:hypothetical protein
VAKHIQAMKPDIIAHYLSEDKPSIEDCAFKFDISVDTASRIIRGAGVSRSSADTKRGKKQNNVANTAPKNKSELEPSARIVRPSIVRRYR